MGHTDPVTGATVLRRGGGSEAQPGWELAVRPTPIAVNDLVVSWCGFAEYSLDPVFRSELGTVAVVMIFGIGQPVHAYRGSASRASSSFVAGMGSQVTTTRHSGSQCGVEVRLSPLGAYRLLRTPLTELTDQVVPLAEVWGQGSDEIIERVNGALTWADRLDVIEQAVTSRAAVTEHNPNPDSEVAAAWERLQRCNGDVAVSELLALTGWSRRRLAERFRQQIGMTPKAVARLLRFRHAVALLHRAGHRSMASIALWCGYYDQAHLNREFREFAGCSPTEYLASRAGDQVAACLTPDGRGQGSTQTSKTG